MIYAIVLRRMAVNKIMGDVICCTISRFYPFRYIFEANIQYSNEVI